MTSAERALLNIEIRNKLRLGGNFEVLINETGNVFVRSTFKNWRLWSVQPTIKEFIFTEIHFKRLK